jgi:hypothetical protein
MLLISIIIMTPWLPVVTIVLTLCLGWLPLERRQKEIVKGRRSIEALAVGDESYHMATDARLTIRTVIRQPARSSTS